MATTWTPYVQQPKAATAKTPEQDYFGRTPEASATLGTISLPKIPGAEAALKSSFDMAQAQQTQRLADLAKFRQLWGESPTATWNSQEQADIDALYNPVGYESQLAGIRGRRAAGMSQLGDAVMGDLRRVLNLSAVGRGPTGLGSYLTRVASSAAARQRAGEVADQATQERADTAALMAARAAMQGRRQTLADSMIQRILQPAQAEASGLGQFQSALAQAIQQALANSTFAYSV